MLSFKMKGDYRKNSYTKTFASERKAHELNFENCDYKIDDIVYTSCTDEFVHEYNKLKVWEILNA